MAVNAQTRVSLAPNYIEDDPEWKRKASLWMSEANQGHITNTGSVTLTSGVASTVLTDSRLGAFSCICFMPTTANAAAEIGNGTLYVATQVDGAATITHANGATGDRTFRYCILG